MAGTKQQGFSALVMALTLGRSPSTITRELQGRTLTGLLCSVRTT
jgi:IS30 family transposase